MKKIKIDFPYKDVESLYIPKKQLIKVLEPNKRKESKKNDINIISKAIENPIGSLRLRDMVDRNQKVLILVDDNTRITPTDIILPMVMKELEDGGVSENDIKLLVATGTHRSLNDEEKIKKYGKEIVKNYEVLDHLWRDKENLVDLPTTSQGTKIEVNKEVLNADFVIGIGQIVPHRVAGFSGGGKIVQPGICGSVTTGQTHWLSAEIDGVEIMGKADNIVRQEIEEVSIKAGLKFIINTIPDDSGGVYKCVCGDPIKAHREGCKFSLDIFAASLSEQGDIVIADSHPADIELWQAAKGIFSAELALKPGGVLVLVSPCKEGVAVEHPQIIEKGYKSFSMIKKMLEKKEIKDLTLAAHLVHVGRICSEKSKCILVSSGIDKVTAEKLGFYYANTPQEGLNLAFKIMSKNAKVVVLKNGGETLPVFN